MVGIPSAAVALARGCLELALHECFPDESAKVHLRDLITIAKDAKTFDTSQATLAEEIRSMGNQVMHEGVCTDAEAFEVIVKVRALIQTLHRT